MPACPPLCRVQMVFIGKDLDADLIREGFQECVVKQ